jgi:hypothetical protein
MVPRVVFLMTLLLSLVVTGCAGDANDTGTRAANPNASNPNPIGPGADVGHSPRDMPGAGRGSAPSKGK